MNDRINDKVQEIEDFLVELESFVPSDLDEYEHNFVARAACERYCEKIVEATVDLAFLIIKDKKLQMAEDDDSAFDILANREIIPKELAKNLKDAKSMRNIIAHEYGQVDDKIVFKAAAEELARDIRKFIKNI